MMSILRWPVIVTLSAVVLFSASSKSQDIDTQASSNYATVLNSLSLQEIRNGAATAVKHGLNPRSYWSEDMDNILKRGGGNTAEFRSRANEGFLRLLSDVSIGINDPALVSEDIRIRRKSFLSPQQLQAVVVSTGQNGALLVETLAPQNAPYAALKNTLARVYPACSNGSWGSLPMPKRTLRYGVRDSSVPAIKKHMALLGYSIRNMDDRVDQEMVLAINDIEWNIHIKPDGSMSPGGRVWKFLTIPCMARVRQIQADMEKIRWFPQRFPDRYIFINLAMSYFAMVDKTRSPAYVTSFRTINGRPERKTPTMRDQVVRVILNPYWVVPPTIFIEDKVAEIRNLPRSQIRQYFDSHNYEVWNKEFTRRLAPESIDWWSIGSAEDSSLYIRQKPHYWNALGVVKFELTNSFSIYLHDTNQRELFYEPQRQLSSGCIRLEKPLDLAAYLLQGSGWDRAKIDDTVAKPGEVMNRDTPITLRNPMPVYTVYLTSFLGSDGVIRFTEDSYGQNQGILRNIKSL